MTLQPCSNSPLLSGCFSLCSLLPKQRSQATIFKLRGRKREEGWERLEEVEKERRGGRAVYEGGMSCNGCRVLRKGCSETCVLRPCLQWIEGAEAQGHATVFVAKFFGRAGLMSFISAVPPSQRPALFQSLLYEACGRTINPVGGAVGLLSGGNWDLCQAAVDAVLRGDTLRPITALGSFDAHNGAPEAGDLYARRWSTFSSAKKRKAEPCDLDLCLTPRPAGGETEEKRRPKRPGTPNSEESVTTSAGSRVDRTAEGFPRLLNLFV